MDFKEFFKPFACPYSRELTSIVAIKHACPAIFNGAQIDETKDLAIAIEALPRLSEQEKEVYWKEFNRRKEHVHRIYKSFHRDTIDPPVFGAQTIHPATKIALKTINSDTQIGPGFYPGLKISGSISGIEIEDTVMAFVCEDRIDLIAYNLFASDKKMPNGAFFKFPIDHMVVKRHNIKVLELNIAKKLMEQIGLNIGTMHVIHYKSVTEAPDKQWEVGLMFKYWRQVAKTLD